MEITVDGLKILYQITGPSGEQAENKEKRYVVILQGWGTTMQVYDSIVASLSDSYAVIQLDLPGFGGSQEPEKSWDVKEYTAFFVHFLEKLGIREVSLIAHSYGGRITIELLSGDCPVSVDKVVLMDSAGIMPVRSAAYKRKVRWYKFCKKIITSKPVSALCPDMVENWKKRQGSSDYRNASPIMREALVKAVNYDQSDLLSKIRQDTLLIWGDADTATPIEDGRKMEQLIPQAGLVTVKGAGHYSFLDQPVLVRNVLRSYFGLS